MVTKLKGFEFYVNVVCLSLALHLLACDCSFFEHLLEGYKPPFNGYCKKVKNERNDLQSFKIMKIENNILMNNEYSYCIFLKSRTRYNCAVPRIGTSTAKYIFLNFDPGFLIRKNKRKNENVDIRASLFLR